MLTTHTAASVTVQPSATGRTPATVRTARTVVIVQGALVLGLGCLLLTTDGSAVSAGVAVASIVEGLLRVTAGICLRRGAHIARILTLVLCMLGIVAGFAAGGVGLVGAGLSVLVGRCLNTDEAKAYFAR